MVCPCKESNDKEAHNLDDLDGNQNISYSVIINNGKQPFIVAIHARKKEEWKDTTKQLLVGKCYSLYTTQGESVSLNHHGCHFV